MPEGKEWADQKKSRREGEEILTNAIPLNEYADREIEVPLPKKGSLSTFQGTPFGFVRKEEAEEEAPVQLEAGLDPSIGRFVEHTGEGEDEDGKMSDRDSNYKYGW